MAWHADRLLVVRSMHADVPNHEPSLMLMNCGGARLVRPSAGAWVTYGLGTENQNLPGFVAMCPGGYPLKGTENWRSAFLPSVFQGTFVDTEKRKVEKLVEYVRHPLLAADVQRRQVDLTAALDREHLAARQHDPALEGRLASMELAWRMQAEAGEAIDVSREPAHVLARYGDTPHGRQLLIARRLVERGVRYVQVWHGESQPWDSHNDIEKNHRKLAGESDGPIGALLDDLVGTACSRARSCSGGRIRPHAHGRAAERRGREVAHRPRLPAHRRPRPRGPRLAGVSRPARIGLGATSRGGPRKRSVKNLKWRVPPLMDGWGWMGYARLLTNRKRWRSPAS